MIDKDISKIYNEFKGLPVKNSIVRLNQKNDAFVILVAKLIFKSYINTEFNKKNINEIVSFIVAPPDNGIDIFLEQEDGDEIDFHICQVKNKDMTEKEINDSFAIMHRTIERYLKSPQLVNENLKKIISETDFDCTYKKKITYYVIHRGDLNCIKGLKSDEKIITGTELEILNESLPNCCVPSEKIKSDKFNNFILYELEDDTKKEFVEKYECEPQAFLCNLKGYDLAKLNNKYASTQIGRNILFGQNLRDSLSKKSKTYDSMCETIDKNPEMFWYYNNGITIIAEEYNTGQKDIKSKDITNCETVELKNFSIINGAQTTSTLGIYLKEAEMNKNYDKIEKIKKVYVLTRIVIIKKGELRNKIAIFNNSQNPISSRDMVSNREEQIKLKERLFNCEEPKIFMEIRRGETCPSRVFSHQKVTNEILAQLAYSSFIGDPAKAKDKKKTLFNPINNPNYTVNEDYHKLFHYCAQDESNCGLLFRKSNEEINELLFIYQLYRNSKKFYKKKYLDKIKDINNKISVCEEQSIEKYTKQIHANERLIEINNNCLFYCITLYYMFKDEFDTLHNIQNKKFYYQNFYNVKTDYKVRIIEKFASMFLKKTIEIINSKSGEVGISNWIKSSKNANIFKDTLQNELTINFEYGEKYKEFVNEFKV